MLTGNRVEDTRVYNRKIIVEAVRRHGPISRAEVAQMTRLTTATISNLTAELIQDGLILEAGRRKGLRGQPAIELILNPEGRFAIGFELGRTHLAGVLMNFVGDILDEFNEEWDSPSPDIALPLMAERVQSLLKQHSTASKRLLGIGVAMPGPFLTNDKRIVSPVKFPAWHEFPVVDKLTDALGFPVIVENDAIAASIGELFHGAGQQYQNFYYVHFGDGLGGAMIIEAHPFQGHSPNTGELGWMRHASKGRRSVIGNFLGLQPLYSMLRGYGLEISGMQDLDLLFEEQNPYLWEWLNEAVDSLDTMLDAINVIFGPEAVFLGGHFPGGILEYLIERLRIEATATLAAQPDRSIVYQPTILRATSGDLSSALGAATLPLYETFSPRPEASRNTGPNHAGA